jgi:hypothetical protein
MREVFSMSTLRIRRKLESDTLVLPELKPLIGKTVEITIQEEEASSIKTGLGDWEAALKAAQELRDTGYDFDAWREQREYDLMHAQDHIP